MLRSHVLPLVLAIGLATSGLLATAHVAEAKTPTQVKNERKAAAAKAKTKAKSDAKKSSSKSAKKR